MALREGSLVVNSSQGGGSKDTWIIDPDVADGASPPDPAHAVAVSQSQSSTSEEVSA